MTLVDQIAQEHAARDPYGFKTQGEASAKHAFVNEPYSHQEYPKVLYHDGKQLIVTDQDAFDKATSEGFTETPSAPAADAPPVVVDTQIVSARTEYLNAAGEVVAVSAVQPITLVATPGTVQIPVAGSGTGRWGEHRVWTETGDGTDYPGSYGVGPETTTLTPGVSSEGEPLKPFEPLPADAPVAETVPVKE